MMMIGAFCQNVGKLFSELKSVITIGKRCLVRR